MAKSATNIVNLILKILNILSLVFKSTPRRTKKRNAKEQYAIYSGCAIPTCSYGARPVGRVQQCVPGACEPDGDVTCPVATRLPKANEQFTRSVQSTLVATGHTLVGRVQQCLSGACVLDGGGACPVAT